MSQKGYNTNLASEFYVLSVLHRLGFDASLTLGNKKAVDIFVTLPDGKYCTLDVKGHAGKSGWFVNNVRANTQNHYIVFVCFDNKMDDISYLPSVWIIPSGEIHAITKEHPSGNKVVHIGFLKKEAARFYNAWQLIS